MSGVGHVRNDADDLLAGGGLASVAHDQQFHDAVVHLSEESRKEWTTHKGREGIKEQRKG